MASTCISNSNMFYCDCDTIEREYDSGPQQHFLDSCSLCKTPITKNSDIFMYRGDTPFCSEECRQEQMQMDREKLDYFRRNTTTATAKRSSSSSSASAKNKGRIEGHSHRSCTKIRRSIDYSMLASSFL